jgi:2-oxoglutarate ferredoxin oxidoreductase subunit delta
MEVLVDRVTIEKDYCKGCELCVEACPHSVLVMSNDFNKSGYHYSIFKNIDDCTSCTFCGIICPDVCIEVYK